MSTAAESRMILIEGCCPADLVVEQIMRLTTDDASVWAFASARPLSAAYLAAMGRFLAVTGTRLSPGSPLLVWAGAGPLDPSWREQCPAVARSVWGELLVLRAVTGTSGEAGACLLDELEQLRTVVS